MPSAALGRLEGDDAEVEAAAGDLGADVARVDAAHVDVDGREALVEPRDERQQAVDGAFVGADEHAAALEVAQLADGRLGLVGQAHQALGVVLQHAARLGQPAVLRRAVEEALAQLVLEAPERLADGRTACGGGAAAAFEKLRSAATARKTCSSGDVHRLTFLMKA